jgi:hypothetical protein
MDKATAQALTELATFGRFSEDTTAALHAALGQHVDDESGLVVPNDAGHAGDDDDKDEDEAPAKGDDDERPAKTTAAAKAAAARKS